MIYINGHDLTIEQVIAVSRQGETVAIAPDARERINAARAYVDRKLADKAVVYGLTTGFGKFSTVFVPEEETAQLQRNLIISHACGMGEPLDTRVVRAAMLLRLNALARGNSGIRLSTMETLLQMLNRGVHPIIPEKGSLGASGDLAPLSHMVLVMLGEGEAEYQGRVMPGREAMAAAGIDVQTVIGEAIEAFAAMSAQSPENPAWQYAAARQHLYQLGKTTEILACYEPSFRFMAEWWKQLYGESEGKNGIGIFPASVEYNADLHSMGQYIQDGPRTLMETVVSFEQPQNEFTVPFAMGDPDRLNYLAGRKLSDISRMAQEAVKAAHIAGGVPNLEVHVPQRDEAGFAWLVCFFELACAISGYMSGVNPFDQPGVEAYKKNMFSLLGKPEAN